MHLSSTAKNSAEYTTAREDKRIMKKFIALPQNLKVMLPSLTKIYLPSFLFIILVWRISNVFGIDIYELTADPAAVAGKPPYVGLISNIGNLLWCGTAAICIFSAFLTKLDRDCFRRWFTFLLCSGVLTTFLLLDDMFQLHEYYPIVFFGAENFPLKDKGLQNLFESFYFIAYLGCFTFYLAYYIKLIKCTEHLFLTLAFFFFGLSVVIDIITPESMPMHNLTEDSFKLLGIISWSAYLSKTCSLVIRQCKPRIN
jgi:hypothetical protein